MDLIPVKDINRLTGYVRGGCSPLGIKRQCKVVIDSSCKTYDKMYVSGGKIGCTLCLSPQTLIDASNATTEDITLDNVLITESFFNILLQWGEYEFPIHQDR